MYEIKALPLLLTKYIWFKLTRLVIMIIIVTETNWLLEQVYLGKKVKFFVGLLGEIFANFIGFNFF